MSVRAIDETSPSHAPIATDAISPTPPPPLQHFEDSSIARATSTEPSYRTSKPKLENPIFHTIGHLNQTQHVYNQYLLLKEKLIQEQSDAIHAMHTEQALQIDEALKAAKQTAFWGVLEDITSTISSATAFFFGTSAALAGSPAIGGALIASGILSIGNIAFKHAHIWDWTADQVAGNNQELREQVRTYLPSAIGLAATALTFAGSYKAWQFATQTGLQMTNNLMKTTADIADGLVKGKSGMTNADHKWKLADLNALQTNTNLSTMDLEKMIQDVEKFHQDETDMLSTIGNILKEQDQAIQMVQQPV